MADFFGTSVIEEVTDTLARVLISFQGILNWPVGTHAVQLPITRFPYHESQDLQSFCTTTPRRLLATQRFVQI